MIEPIEEEGTTNSQLDSEEAETRQKRLTQGMTPGETSRRSRFGPDHETSSQGSIQPGQKAFQKTSPMRNTMKEQSSMAFEDGGERESEKSLTGYQPSQKSMKSKARKTAPASHVAILG